jgi:hypothetical protein
MARAVPADEGKTVDFRAFFRRDEHLFPGELPAVGDIARSADMAFISIKKVDQPPFKQFFEFCKAL